MADIPFSPSTAPGLREAESGGRLINAYGEPLQGSPLAQFTIRRTSGLTPYSNTGETVYRGSFFDSGTLFTGWSEKLKKTDSLAATTDAGALAGTDWLTFARNMKTPIPDYLVNSQAGLFSFTAGG